MTSFKNFFFIRQIGESEEEIRELNLKIANLETKYNLDICRKNENTECLSCLFIKG